MHKYTTQIVINNVHMYTYNYKVEKQGRLDFTCSNLLCSITLPTHGKPLKLLECMAIQIGNHVPDGLFQGNYLGKGRSCSIHVVIVQTPA